MIKKNMVLFGAYVSAQWIAMARLTAVYQPGSFSCLVCGMCLLHLVVLLQQTWSFQCGLQHEELLEEQKLLRLGQQHTLSIFFGALVLLLTVLFLSGVPPAWSQTSQLSGIALTCISLGLHAKHLYDATASSQRWREPQVQSKEYLVLTMLPLQSIDAPKPELTGERAQKWLLAKAFRNFRV
ncbi:unnamed protein product [Symbiodinium sp. CCMP2592]|nr:unnamed protein product [Symbiodinium sp. CCMP2592]